MHLGCSDGIPRAIETLARSERITVGIVCPTFVSNDCRIVYQESAHNKSDFFTKRLSPAMFELAIERLGLMRSTAFECVRFASR